MKKNKIFIELINQFVNVDNNIHRWNLSKIKGYSYCMGKIRFAFRFDNYTEINSKEVSNDGVTNFLNYRISNLIISHKKIHYLITESQQSI